MPTEVLYAVISALSLALLTLAGLWVKAHDDHRSWSTLKITEHEKLLAVLETDYRGIAKDISDIKMMISDHTALDRKFQLALIRKLDLKVEDT